MYNNLFTIGNLTVHTYGLMIAIGFIAAYLVAEYRARKQGLDYEKILDLSIWALVIGFLGGKILYILTDIGDILANPKILLNFSNGFVVYGGILAGILTGYIFCRIHKLPFLKYADIILPSVALNQGFGRIGCFMAGCCYGEVTKSPISVVFSHSEFAPNHVHLIPTQLISSGLDFINFFVLIWLAKRIKREGEICACYLIFYSIGRFVIPNAFS